MYRELKDYFLKTDNFHSRAYTEKTNFMQFVYSLANERMKRVFRFPGTDFSLWWLSLVAEKPVIKSSLYEDLISFLVSREKTGVSKKRVFRKRLFLNFVYGSVVLFIFAMRAIYTRMRIGDFRKRMAKLHKDKYVIVTYFPYLDREELTNSEFINKYLEPFHRGLKKEARDEYSHICMPVDIDGFRFNDSVRLLNKFKSKESLFIIDEFLNFRDLFLSFLYYFYFVFVFIFNLRWIKAQVNFIYNGKKFEVWDIFRNDFYRSFSGDVLATSIMYMLVFKKVTEQLNPAAKIVTICEMQWWEKALYLNARKRGLTTIGYQHCQVPVLLLNYFSANEEIGDDTESLQLAFPDYLATVGKVTQNLFYQSGWPKDRVFIWGAQRFEAFKNLDILFSPWEERDDYIVCALPIDVGEAKSIISLLRDAYNPPPSYKILLKSHPTVDLEQIFRCLNIKLDSSIFRVSDVPLDRLMRKAKAMIVTKSSACFYALAAGSYVIVPRFPNSLDCNPLSYLTDFPLYSYSAGELRNICDRIMSASNGPDYHEKARIFLKEYFYFPESDSEYLLKINSLPRWNTKSRSSDDSKNRN